MKVLVRWRWEGEMLIDAKSTDAAAEHVMQTFADTNLFNTSVDDYDTDTVEILDVKIVGPS